MKGGKEIKSHLPIIERKKCGCTIRRGMSGIPIHDLCKTHSRMLEQGKDIK